MSRKILLTNDDGIDSDGLIRLAEVAKKFGDVYVVAPDSQRSAMSHSITLRHPMYLKQYDFPVEGVVAYSCDGTPGDCVRIGHLNIVPGGADVLMSGVNFGYNVATDLQYSATVGAAMEGAFLGIHSIAFSEDFGDCHETTDEYLEEIMAEVIDAPLDKDQIWNVNFPGCKNSECKGILRGMKVSGDVFYKDHYDEKKMADGRIEFTIVGERRWEAEEGTDLRAVLDNYVSVGIATNIK
ncbi:MAG: 5'/3'-nucleotidase SurE [Lachnospiraceae bacterium]|nr:5'/3'-nucleotidase SurE [Candidatus Colinaster scatohippi]